MKNQIKFLLILSSLIWAFASVSCNNELKENPTYYTVSFDSDGGSFVAAQTVESGKTAVEPRSPTKSGYTFDDWYKDSSVFDFLTPITSNLTLKAKWTKIQNKENPTYYTVSFDSDGGSFVAAQTVESGKTAVEPRSPTKSGYTFDDWYKDSSVFDFLTPITSNLTLKAKWTKIQNNDSQNDNNTEENGNENKTDENGNENKTDKTPPAEVSGLTVTENHKRIILNWINPADEDFASVEIICEPAEGSLSEPQKIQGNPTEEKSYTISNLENGKEYKITIKTIDSSNNKSTGVTKTASPKESKINLEVSLPNDDGENIILTNDKATINVTISPTDQVVKAVWKKGGSAGMSDGDALLSDDSATVLVFNSNIASFTVTENGYYDIAVRNSEGVTECIRTEIKTIDKTPFAEVTNLTSESDGQNIYVSWENPASQNKYDSPLKTVILSYVYNDDENDAANGEITLNAGEEQTTIPIAVEKTDEDFVRITVKVVDELGNVSQGYKIQQACDGYVYITSRNEDQKIQDIRKSGKIVIAGDVEDSKSWMGNISVDENGSPCGGNSGAIWSYLWTLQQNNPDIRLDLDLSGLIVQQQATVSNLSGHMENTGTCFSGLTCLNSIILPEGITIIGDFYDCSNFTSIVIPESVTTIDSSAFSNCYNLTNIVLPAGITSIGISAFKGSGLTNIEIPDNVTNIGEKAFQNCENLRSVVLPKNLSNIKQSLFENCRNLMNINIPNNVTSIGMYSFKNCSALTSITIPGSVQTTGANAFENCSNLETVTIMSRSIGEAAFKNCSKLRNITLADSVTGIYNNAFENCSSLTSITIPDSVTGIGNNAFENCSSLTCITIPNSVTGMGKEIFSGCSSLEEITIPFIGSTKTPSTPYSHYVSETTFGYIFGTQAYDNSIVVEQHDCISEGSRTYYLPATLKKVTVTGGRLWNYAFQNCSNLNEIILQDGVTDYRQEDRDRYFCGNNAFENCNNLTSITIPDTVREIGIYAFKNCSKLESITIPASVKKIGGYAFENCISLNNVIDEDNKIWYQDDLNGNERMIGVILATYLKQSYRYRYYRY